MQNGKKQRKWWLWKAYFFAVASCFQHASSRGSGAVRESRMTQFNHGVQKDCSAIDFGKAKVAFSFRLVTDTVNRWRRGNRETRDPLPHLPPPPTFPERRARKKISHTTVRGFQSQTSFKPPIHLWWRAWKADLRTLPPFVAPTRLKEIRQDFELSSFSKWSVIWREIPLASPCSVYGCVVRVVLSGTGQQELINEDRKPVTAGLLQAPDKVPLRDLSETWADQRLVYHHRMWQLRSTVSVQKGRDRGDTGTGSHSA